MLVGPHPHSLSSARARSGRRRCPRAPGLELSSWLMVSCRTIGLGLHCAIVGILLGLVSRGYGSEQATPPAQLSGEDAKARQTFVSVCVKCHPVERVTAKADRDRSGRTQSWRCRRRAERW